MGVGFKIPARGVVGLDIQSDTIAAVELSPTGGVRHAALENVPMAATKDGQFVNEGDAVAAIKQFFREHKFGRRVRLGISDPHVVVRILELPALDDKQDLDAAVRFKATEEIPMPLEEAVIDYQVVDRVTDARDLSLDRVVLVAAPKEMIDRTVGVMRKAGLKLTGIDLSAFALIRALYGQADSLESGVTAYCHLGDVTTLAVAKGSTCLFARTVAQGVKSPDEVLAAVDAIKLSLDYYGAQEGAEPVTATLFTGPGTVVEGLVGNLERSLSCEVKVAAPTLGDSEERSAYLSLAYGLALEEAVAR